MSTMRTSSACNQTPPPKRRFSPRLPLSADIFELVYTQDRHWQNLACRSLRRTAAQCPCAGIQVQRASASRNTRRRLARTIRARWRRRQSTSLATSSCSGTRTRKIHASNAGRRACHRALARTNVPSSASSLVPPRLLSSKSIFSEARRPMLRIFSETPLMTEERSSMAFGFAR